MIIQTSCSELLVDTSIYDPVEAYERFSLLARMMEWDTSPPLTPELFKRVKATWKDDDGTWDSREEVMFFDRHGNRAWLQYGSNGYISTGFRLDSQCNHGDDRCYPIFRAAIEKLNGRLIACDGGSTYAYEEWDNGRS